MTKRKIRYGNDPVLRSRCEEVKVVDNKIRSLESHGLQECIEGCLSFPDRFAKTIRPYEVTIQALNEYGEEVVITGKGEMAKCFCHELEHLDGKIFLDKAIEEIDI